MKQLVKNLFFGILALPILDVIRLIFKVVSKSYWKPWCKINFISSISENYRKKCYHKKVDDIVAPTRTKLVLDGDFLNS